MLYSPSKVAFKDRTKMNMGELKENQGCRAAFFDVDHTLIRGDTQALEARYLLGTLDRISPRYIRDAALVLTALLLYRAERISLVRQNEIYLKIYKGRAETDLVKTGKTLYRQVVSRLFLQGALDLMAAHRSRGDLIVWVSASTPHLLAPMAAVLEPDYVFCTELEFDGQGRATGRALDGICAQEKKSRIVTDFATEYGIDLLASHAYSDHHSDIPFLASTGHPAVVNPSPEMASHARNTGWPIHLFD